MPSKLDLDTFRGSWARAKDLAESDNKGNKDVTALLKSFDKDLGPTLDKLLAAMKAKRGEDALTLAGKAAKIAGTYKARAQKLPKTAWTTDKSRMWLIAALDGFEQLPAMVRKKFAIA